MTIEFFLKNRYKKALTTKCRNRELVMQRRMLSLFLVNELNMKKVYAGRILGISHQAVCQFLKPVYDPQFEKYCQKETETLLPQILAFCQPYNQKAHGKR